MATSLRVLVIFWHWSITARDRSQDRSRSCSVEGLLNGGSLARTCSFRQFHSVVRAGGFGKERMNALLSRRRSGLLQWGRRRCTRGRWIFGHVYSTSEALLIMVNMLQSLVSGRKYTAADQNCFGTAAVQKGRNAPTRVGRVPSLSAC